MDSQLKGVLSAMAVALPQLYWCRLGGGGGGGGGGGEGVRVGRASHKGEPLQICLGSGSLLVVGE